MQQAPSTRVHLQATTARKINFASAQNDVPVLTSCVLHNPTPLAYENVAVTLSSEPAVFKPRTWTVDRLAPDSEFAISDLAMPLDIQRLAGLNETEVGELALQVVGVDGVLFEEKHRLEFLARDHWGGLGEMGQLLAAFVSPNDSVVARLLKEASALLVSAGHRDSLEGYQSEDPQRVWMMAGAIWSAATAMGLTYATPAASFEQNGQKIRTPERLRAEGLATCLDTSLLLAAAWEQAGLNVAVLFDQGHAWAGVWLVDRDFGQVTEPDVVAVRKAVQAGEFVCVETTLLTQRPTVGFTEAADAGRARLAEDCEHNFVVAIDVARARSARIRPLASHVAPQTFEEAELDVLPARLPEPIDVDLLPADDVTTLPDTPRGRIERWQAKLLDLSLRNRLLNFSSRKQALACLVPDISAWEDALAAGKSFTFYPMMEDDPIGDRRLSPEKRGSVVAGVVKEAYGQGQITVPLARAAMDAQLLKLYRKTRSDLQEGGTNTLFMAAGVLRWQRDGDSRTYRAPLLLIPVKLARRSAKSPFSIEHHEDDVRVNATLLEMLKRDFQLIIPELEGDLPQDGSGIDLPRLFALLRHRIRDVPGFEVVEELSISSFSFSKYLMWKDLVDRTEALRSNRLVAHLVDNPERAFERVGGTPVQPDELDRLIEPKDLFTPLPADSSQLAAVVAAMQGRDFVLIGPPGTGKSQTIANIICQCLATGKTVLFVAEKSAALDVVQRRLAAQGLDDAILELHSNKTDRRHVLSQLGKGWARATAGDESAWLQINEKLKIKREQLNAYVEALHRPGTQGFSVFEAMGRVASTADSVIIKFGSKDAHDKASFEQLEDMAYTIGTTHQGTGAILRLPLVGNTEWSHSFEASLIDCARTLLDAVVDARLAACDMADLLGLKPEPQVSASRRQLLKRLAFCTDGISETLRAAFFIPQHDLLPALARYEHSVHAMQALTTRFAAQYPDDVIGTMPLDDIERDWVTAVQSFWPLSVLRKHAVQKHLQRYATSGRAQAENDIPLLIQLRQQLTDHDQNPLVNALGKSEPLEYVSRIVEQTATLHEVLDTARSVAISPHAFHNLVTQLLELPDGVLSRKLQQWQQTSQQLNRAASSFLDAGGVLPKDESLTWLVNELERMLKHQSSIADWTRWLSMCQRAELAGLGKLCERVTSMQEPIDAVKTFKASYARWWLPLAMDASDELRTFAHWHYEETVQAFSGLDDLAAQSAPAEIMRRIMHGLPAQDRVSKRSELGVLRHQLALQRPSMPIRTLLGNLTETFPKLAPCVLMSPLSIAQYLPAGQATFDVVIFDEASQITTWDAVGAIARARQSIVVGDPKQLPPTNFFGRNTEDDEEDLLMSDMPSILDEVATAGVPVRQLDWHYRSRDEALIAFSNHFYYDNRLVTFPAPLSTSDALNFHKIDGTYARGKTRTNVAEAKAIAEMVRARLTLWLLEPEAERFTLGVITFNQQQQALILDLLDQVRRDAPELEWFFSDDREEPLIVKNLENIQGDERDVMLFSITFGPDTEGKFTMNFGALNNEGGEKRLNVAVTRARRVLHVFASITHDQIDLSRTRALGVSHLKTFLDYADRGAAALPARDHGSQGAVENPFEEAVAEAFRRRGWEVRTQIGVSGYRIDLAIVHPDIAGAYLAGIECDGATYHSSATARDRDKIRQGVLEGLGWMILRVWSTEWFRSPIEIVDRLHLILTKELAEHRACWEAQPVDVDLLLDDTEKIQPPLAVDAPNNTNTTPDPEQFFNDSYLETLQAQVADVVNNKSPLTLQNLAREIALAHGWQRTGNRILARVEDALDKQTMAFEFGEPFIWPAAGSQKRCEFRGLDERALRDVSRTEIATVLDDCRETLAASEDSVVELARRLGVQRLSASNREYLGRVLEWYEKETADS